MSIENEEKLIGEIAWQVARVAEVDPEVAEKVLRALGLAQNLRLVAHLFILPPTADNFVLAYRVVES